MFRDEYNYQGNEGLAELANELERQAGIYHGLVDKDVVMRLLAPRPDGLPKEFLIPVVTLGASVDLNRQVRFAGITPYFDLSLAHDAAGGLTSDQPHLKWMQDGGRNKGRSVEWVRAHPEGSERPATLADGVALAIVHPNIRRVLRDHVIDLPGSSVGSDRAPVLFDWNGDLELDLNFVGSASSDCGSASSGS